MFNLLGSKPSGKVKYLVYLTKIAKYRQLMAHLQAQLNEGVRIHLVAHFDQTLEELKQMLDRSGTPYVIKEDDTHQSDLVLSKSDWLKSRGQILEDYDMIVAEIYPTTAREESLKALKKEGIAIFCALDNPFFEMMGGERIRSLMGKLGIPENEAIEHTMVTKAIQNAQQKMDRKVNNEKPAATMREWMSMNAR